jgi:hypothetical protein
MMWVFLSQNTICNWHRMTRITVRLRSAVAATARHVCNEANKRAIYTHKREKEKENERDDYTLCVWCAGANNR